MSRAFAGGALALAALLTGCGGGGGSGPLDVAGLNFPRPRDYPIHGIDVSKFQGDIDWSQVAGSGVQFAWIKASEGGDRADDRFEANWQGAKAAGVPHGAYHFVYWCRPPMEEMANFEQNAPVEPDALPPVLDVEATPTSKTCHRHLTEAGAIHDMQIMLDEMERHYGKRPVIYTTVDFYQAILVRRRLLRLSDLGALDQIPPLRQIRWARLALLAVPVRRVHPRDRGQGRPRRVFRHPRAMGGVPAASGQRPPRARPAVRARAAAGRGRRDPSPGA